MNAGSVVEIPWGGGDTQTLPYAKGGGDLKTLYASAHAWLQALGCLYPSHLVKLSLPNIFESDAVHAFFPEKEKMPMHSFPKSLICLWYV